MNVRTIRLSRIYKFCPNTYLLTCVHLDIQRFGNTYQSLFFFNLVLFVHFIVKDLERDRTREREKEKEKKEKNNDE